MRRLALAAALCLTPASANAGLLDPDPPKPRERTEWYGWQPLLVDAATAGVLFSLVGSDIHRDGRPLLALYSIGTPFVHALHERVGVAGASFGLRMIPLVLALGGPCPVSKNDDSCTAESAWVVTGIGMGLVTLLDVAALSWQTVPVRPSIGAVAGGRWTFGVAGDF